jgi:carbon-monoxide dehydrogenase small subunit
MSAASTSENRPAPLTLRFSLNGVQSHCVAPPERRLATILRDDFGLTAARSACGIGRCGACMVLWNDRPVNSCLVMAWQLDGAEIVTAEGLDALPEARIVKAALVEENSFQCGYCAPGFVVTLTALLREHALAGEAEIRRALAGNLCRCTGYHSILRGALHAVALLARANLQPTGEPS